MHEHANLSSNDDACLFCFNDLPVMEKLAQVRRPQATASEMDALTAREREVLELICSGHGDAAIAERLGLSRNTVRNHVATLYGKIGVNRRSTAVIWGRERGFGASAE